MKFLDLNKLTIKDVKSERVECHEIVIGKFIPSTATLRDLSNIITEVIEKVNLDVIHTGQVPYYMIRLSGEIDDTMFETLVGLITNALAKRLMIAKGRTREHRLDVPENLLEDVFMNRSTLKNLINHQSLYDVFNIKITANDDLIYNLVKE